MRNQILLWILLFFCKNLSAQSKGAKFNSKNLFVLQAEASKNAKEKATGIGGGLTTPKAEKPIATIVLSCDIPGKLWINNKNYEIIPTEELEISLYKEQTNFYFIGEGDFNKNDKITINPDQQGKKIVKNILYKKELDYYNFKKKENSDKELILNTIYDNFVPIHVDEEAKDAQLSDFEISRFETTVFQYALFKNEMIKDQLKKEGADSSLVLLRNSLFDRAYVKGVDWRHDPSGVPLSDLNSNLPVSNVSWDDAMQYAEWLSSKDKYYRYRLPTIKEWEFAAGCGTYRFPYPWGDNLESNEIPANTADITLKNKWVNARNHDPKINDYFDMTAPVGQFTPNCFGIYDLTGNVSEWCLDTSVDKKYGTAFKTYKGGSFYSMLKDCLIKNTYNLEAHKKTGGIGFRMCRVPK